eukprot:SAG11_NODE_11990_length_727_cov_1.393312_1_plen_43_part_01
MNNNTQPQLAVHSIGNFTKPRTDRPASFEVPRTCTCEGYWATG